MNIKTQVDTTGKEKGCMKTALCVFDYSETTRQAIKIGLMIGWDVKNSQILRFSNQKVAVINE